MRVIVVGAGQVGHTVVKSLAETHECTVIDIDQARLEAVSHAYDVRIAHGSGTWRETLLEAGVADAELVLACTSRDEVNLVTAMLARRLSSARTVVRATGTDCLEAWRAGDLDVDLLVSTAFETASAVARVLHVPGARHVDFFSGGEVVVLALAVLPRLRIGGRELLRSELPGPVEMEPLGATVRGTARRLWKVYLAVTVTGALVLACLGNVGPAFGEVGPFGSYAPLGHLSKAILTALMLLGRIEIVPLAVLLRRSYWRA